MHSPTVQLKSGGYIVINSTEALVAVDVNSGRSTRERNIEETAYKTNLEAAEEVARQLRLRDLAGLIVIDFIDMDENRNVRRVERCLKDCLKSDRARIQVGRISSFGLLEMSRQRMRPSLIEASTEMCPHCQGAGVIRSTESSALHVLHAIEDEGIQGRSSAVTVQMATAVALCILNQKRTSLVDIEERFDLHVSIEGDDSLNPPEFRIERTKTRSAPVKDAAPAENAAPPNEEPEISVESRQAAVDDEDSTEDAPKKRRRRGRRGGRRRRRKEETGESVEAEAAGTNATQQDAAGNQADGDQQPEYQEGASEVADDSVGQSDAAGADEAQSEPITSEAAAPEDLIGADGSADGSNEPDEASTMAVEAGAEEQPTTETESSRDEAILIDSMDVVNDAGIDATEMPQPDAEDPPAAAPDQADEDDEKPKRRGWWQRSSA